jgi:hypothetical protein
LAAQIEIHDPTESSGKRYDCAHGDHLSVSGRNPLEESTSQWDPDYLPGIGHILPVGSYHLARAGRLAERQLTRDAALMISSYSASAEATSSDRS